MKIDSSTIGMASSRRYTTSTRHTLSLMSVHQSKLDDNASAQNKSLTTGNQRNKSLEDALARFKNQNSTIRKAESVDVRDEIEKANRIRNQCIRYLLDLFLGDESRKNSAEDTSAAIEAEQSSPTSTVLNYNESFYYSEQETTSFSTTGKVVTADGREISFNLDMQMSRSFESYYESNYTKTLNFCDPLVINLDGDIAEVSDQKFLFDLDCDGEEENISFLNSGSGYLALDKNGDGQINNGSELFGTKSGDGFADLLHYDKDGNGWIDENDDIFHKLVIWSKDENGKDVMYKLADKGVGAICLQNVSTNFALNSQADNSTNAMIRKTGIFLYETGDVETVQHLDMAT